MKTLIHSYPRWYGAGLALQLFGALLAPSVAHAVGPAHAVGTLAVLLPNGAAGSGIEIPDAKVTLRDLKATTVAAGRTDLDGSFRLKAPLPGAYDLCWNIQGRTGCRRLKLNEGTNSLRVVEIGLEGLLVYGRVLTGDQRPCWVRDPFFALSVSTRVRLLDSLGQAAATPVRANTRGYYLLLPAKGGRFTVRANCEKAVANDLVSLTGGSIMRNLTLPNHAPRIDELAAREAGRARVRVLPGAELKLATAVHDRENDPVRYLWRSNDALPLVVGGDTLAFKAPSEFGRHSNYLIVGDGKGGYAYKRIDTEVGAQRIQISGIVIDEVTRLPVAGATAQFGARAMKTSARGWFSLTGRVNADDRYVLNIRHPNYALMSRVYDRSSTGNTYEMIRAQRTTHPVSGSISLIDQRSSGPCGGQDSTLPPPTRLQTVEYIDPDNTDAKPLGADLIKRLTATPPCERLGARIIIPDGALVRPDQSAAQGSIRAAIATLNPTRRAIPGDFQAIDGNGNRAELLSYGAVHAEFRDGTGALLNLRPGTTATVRVPVPPALRATATPTIDFWSYNESTGRWTLEGKATLVNTASGPIYAAKTRHFSTLNMDVAGNDPANATCVRFEVGPSLAAWTNLKMRATVSYNGNAVQTKETFLDSNQYHAVYRIPFGAAFPPNTLRVELFGTFNGQTVVLVDNIINTDARPKMTGTNLWPPYPYEECGVPVQLNADPIALPAYKTNDATNRPYFLTGPSGAFLPADAEAAATAYYTAIDPGNTKTTLGDWWAANGFGATDGSGGTRASYLNHNDLGFGRDMHCRQSGANLACYVTNYGAADQNPANADAAAAQDASLRGATVAMELNAAAGAEAVQFYVYANTGPSSVRLKFADLDGFGPKPVPQLCQVCHGGGPGVSASGRAEHARFREFDLPSFKYSGSRSWDYGAATLNNAELTAFRTLNRMVRDTGPATTPIHDLIEAWYPSNLTLAPVEPNAGTVPTGWSGNVSGYNNVYGKTCRTCHVARDEGLSPPGYFVFDSLTSFQSTSYAVCGLAYRVMPNAIVTYKNFWADSARVLAYEALMNPPVPANTCQND